MASYIGNIPNFDVNSQDWGIFKSRLEQFLILNKFDSEDQKRAVLLTHLSENAYKLLISLAHPISIETARYEKLVEILSAHFSPKRSSFADKDAFYSASQEEGEAVADWAARLRGLAVHCEFGAALEMILRDRFVLGLRTGAERERLFEQDVSNLTIAKALEVAQQVSCARKSRAAATSEASMSCVKQEQLFRASAHECTPARQATRRPDNKMRKCTVCGLKNHLAKECRYRSYRCDKCKEKGHLKKVCVSKMLNVNNLSVTDTQMDSGGDCEECNLLSLRCVGISPILIPVLINDSIELHMELDTGSSISVISDKLYQKYFAESQLSNDNLKLCLYNGHKISPLGYFVVKLKYKGVEHSMTLYVIKNGGPPLLGRQFMTKFKIALTSHINNINTVSVSSGNLKLQQLLNKYDNLFADELGCFNHTSVSFKLKDNAYPKYFKARPLPFAIKDKVEAEIARLVNKGILIPTPYSQYASPIVAVPKPNGSVRICGDYSLTVNKDIHIDKYPLPRIEEVFAKLGGGELYSKIDCSQAYAQLRLSPQAQKLTTINTSKGLFMYTRLVYGLANAPAIFQRAIENLLAGIEGVAVFLDDVCLTGASEKEHLSRLQTVFQRFKDAGLKLQKDKCVFFQKSVKYLGHIIDKHGLHKCPSKVEAINKAPRPTNTKELKRFLGMVNYYRSFVPNASSILSPLNCLLRADTDWEWGDSQQRAFEQIKHELSSDKVLTHFNPNAQLVLTVDAGPTGLASVLSQVSGDGIERPLAFASRSLSVSERNYSQLHKEATAIIFGVKKFHQYLYGRKDPFILKTDHKPLLAIFGKNTGISVMTASRLVRYAIFLSAYNYRIQYISSENNKVADYFSRAPLPSTDSRDVDNSVSSDNCHCLSINSLQIKSLPITYVEIKNATATDKTLVTVLKYLKQGWPRKIKCPNILPYFMCKNELETENDCLLRGHRVVIPLIYRHTILKELHKSHQGIVKTKSLAREKLWWPGIDRDIERTISACNVCSALRPAPPRAVPAPWPRSSQPWDRLHIDYMTIGQKDYLVVVDAYSKWLECIAMSSGTQTRQLISKLRNLFSIFGLPRCIVSDNDAKIASQEFIQFCRANGIKYITSPIYHPCSNGQAENAVKSCKKMIKAIFKSSGNTIAEELCDYLFEYRNTPHCATGQTPARSMFSRDLRTRLDLIKPPPKQFEKVEELLLDKCRYFKVGQKVWVKCFENKKHFWEMGSVEKFLGRRMYIVKLIASNITCKRHVDQLWQYSDSSDKHNTVSTSGTPTTQQLLCLPPPLSKGSDPYKETSTPEVGNPEASIQEVTNIDEHSEELESEVTEQCEPFDNWVDAETVETDAGGGGETQDMTHGPVGSSKLPSIISKEVQTEKSQSTSPPRPEPRRIGLRPRVGKKQYKL